MSEEAISEVKVVYYSKNRTAAGCFFYSPILWCHLLSYSRL